VRTRNIERHPEYNCQQIDHDGTCYDLLGRRDGRSEPRRHLLDTYVRLRDGPDVKRGVNGFCEGFYSTMSYGEHCRFESTLQ
jgi:hypothetical protein